MASENMHLYDEVKDSWYKIALESDIQDLVTSMDDNELQLIPSEQGSRGLRYFNNKLEYSTDEGVTWAEIQTGGGVDLPSEITDINGLQDALDSKVDSADLTPIQEDITNIQTELVTKGTVKSVNGEFPDVNGNVVVNGDTSQVETELQNHLSDKNNPHSVTKEQVGLENVDNTSDLNKPISNATQIALDSKLDVSAISPIEQSISDLETSIALKGNVKTVNGVIPDTNGNVEIQTDGDSVNVVDNLTSISSNDALSANMGKSLNDELTSHKNTVDVVNTHGHVQIDDVTIKLGTDGKIYSVGGGNSSVTVIDDLTSTSTTDALSAYQGKVLKEMIDTKTSSPISADDVTDSTNRVMVTPSQRTQIANNSTDIIIAQTKITSLEQLTNGLTSALGKVKIDATDANGYLEDKIDGITIQKSNNKVVAKSLDGLESSVTELNFVKGVTSNIQDQLNALSSVVTFTTSVENYADLASLTLEKDDMVIVLEDETKNNKSTVYIYDGTSPVYVGDFKGGEIRDFTTQPIDLALEVTGILSKDKYVKQNATDTEVEDSDDIFTSTNVEGVLKELNVKIDDSKTVLNDTLTSTSTTEALTANKGKELNDNLINHEGETDVVNGFGHVKIDNDTIKINADGKIYSVGSTSVVDADDVVESTTKVFVSPAEKTDITHINREVIDKLTESTDGKLLFNGNEISAVDESEITRLEELITSHENKKVSDVNGVHGLSVTKDKMSFLDENDTWVEYDSSPSMLPSVRSLVGTASNDGSSITVTWINPSNTEYEKTELYASKTNITNLDYEELQSAATKVVDNNTTTTYIENTVYGDTYYFKAYAFHSSFGESKFATPTTVSVRSEDVVAPSDVTNISITPLDSKLKLTWANPTESDFQKVKVMFKENEYPTSHTDGIVAYEGSSNTVTIDSLTNNNTYYIRFFVYDIRGNVNDSANMQVSASPIALQNPTNLTISSNTAGTQMTVSWINPTVNTFSEVEVYISNSDLTSKSQEECSQDATLIYNGASTNTNTNVTPNLTYYVKVFVKHINGGIIGYSSGVTTSKLISDTEAPSVVVNVVIENLDGSLKVTWTNPPEQDLGNVRLNYSTSTINSINDGTMAFNGTGNTVTITGLTNGTTYHLRFFTIDNSGNINSDESMKYTGKPSPPIPKFYDTLTTIGATETIDGAAYNEAGYFGTVSASELFTATELSNAVGITQGTIQNDNVEWLKFYIDNKIIFVAKKTIRNSISWDMLNNGECVFGTKEVTKNGITFKVRLMQGALTNPSSYDTADRGAIGSEWNRLMLPINIKATDKSWTYPKYVESDVPNWSVALTDEDMLTAQGFGNGFNSWCQETPSTNTTNRVFRGNSGVSDSRIITSTNSAAAYGWRPVLEVVDPNQGGN